MFLLLFKFPPVISLIWISFSKRATESNLEVPATSNLLEGRIVPIPTFPSFNIVNAEFGPVVGLFLPILKLELPTLQEFYPIDQ